MRNSYLESYYNILPKIQQDRLLDILKRQYDEAGETPSDITLKERLEGLIAELKEPLGVPLMQYRKAEKYSKINSRDYNDMMEEVYVDLGALFKQNNVINEVIKTHKILNDTVLRDVRSILRKVSNDLVVYKVVKENKTGITDAKFNTFYKDDNQSQSMVYKGCIDTDTNALKLPASLSNSAININGVSMAEIELRHYGGGIRGTLETEEHRREKAIDESDETFWGEVILTDEPIRQTYDGETEFGTICEIIIRLFRRELINHVKFTPFTNYPLRIMKIKYKEDSNSSWNDLGVTEQESVNTMEFNFSEVSMKEVMIVINQKNPSVNTYKIPKRVINNIQLWQQIADREYSISTSTETPIQATQDMIDNISGWQAYEDALEKYNDRIEKLKILEETDSITETIFDAITDQVTEASEKGADELKLDLYGEKANKAEELIEVRKYEYSYGAYNINVKRLWYLEMGEYLSPKYLGGGTIVEAELDITSVVPSGTSIEYGVTTREEEWHNILDSSGYITQERLDIDPITQEGELRFRVDGYPFAVYRDNTLLPSGIVTDPSGYSYDSDTKTVTIGDGWWAQNAIYTVSYQPRGTLDVSPSGVRVSFQNDALIDAEETFINTDSREYKLELDHNPYIRYDIINDTTEGGELSPVFTYTLGRWLNSGGAPKYGLDVGDYYDVLIITVDGHSAENRTDYYENEHPALTPYDGIKYPDFEYLHINKNLYFNTPLADREVKVRYEYLNDYIRFKALLRNNDVSNVTTTPVLNDYTLKLRTL